MRIHFFCKASISRDHERSTNGRRRLVCIWPLLFGFALFFPITALSVGPAFWVWNRDMALSPAEIAQLRRIGVDTLYWQVGELRYVNHDWVWQHNSRSIFPAEFRIIPVLRLEANDRNAFSVGASAQLVAKIRDFVQQRNLNELQLDFDCPDRLLPQYSQALAQCRAAVRRLSVTALAGWKERASFNALQANADEIVPMFYDLEPDGLEGSEPRPHPLIDPSVIAQQLAAWRNCQKPWRAGLPNFNRVTLYDHGGAFRGHLRGWNWNDLCFNPSVRDTGRMINGGALFRIVATNALAGAPLAQGDWICARTPDRSSLSKAARLAGENGAAGVVYFRLPDKAEASGWSLPQFVDLDKTSPELVLRSQGEGFELSNSSDADLAPRLMGKADDQDRGYALEIDAPSAIWREAMPGDFWRVNSHAIVKESAKSVAVPFANRLTFWFSQLRAHQSLATGLVSLAPAAKIDSLRYRVLNTDCAAAWRKIE